MIRLPHPTPTTVSVAISMSRRRALQTLGGIAALAAVGSLTLSLKPAFALLPPPAGDAALTQFMTLSAWLTGRPALDAALGQRYFAALSQRVPDLARQVAALSALLKERAAQGQQAFCDFVDASGAAHATLPRQILAAWYTGQVDVLPKPQSPHDRAAPPQNGTATVVAYEVALMYQATGDVLAIPSYCRDVPGYWSQQPQEAHA